MLKQKSHAFGKDVYLIGKTREGELVWLEAPSWDCGWYWGFGYMETYTSERPDKSRDISSHQHFSGFVGQMHEYDFDKKVDVKTKYVHHINESPMLLETVLNDGESWELSDLMSRFYTLRETAEILHRGTANLTSRTAHTSKNDEFLKWINEVEIPAITHRVMAILTLDKL